VRILLLADVEGMLDLGGGQLGGEQEEEKKPRKASPANAQEDGGEERGRTVGQCWVEEGFSSFIHFLKNVFTYSVPSFPTLLDRPHIVHRFGMDFRPAGNFDPSCPSRHP